ncbi:MAG TPA: glycosyltransferase family 4 protein [Candidatus Acidoferrales bacterium]|nr:glycosyltransferase family 4 protein [Candidatus Acidoferrales bacterium]
MKLLIYARDWAPSVGGVQTIVKTLADGLADWSGENSEEAIEVTLLTQTPAGGMNASELPYRVVRKPGVMDFIREMRRADVVHLAGPTLVPLIIGYLLRKPTIVEHHGFQAICPNGQLLYEPTQTPCPGYFMARQYGECIRCNSKLGRLTSLKMWMLTFPRRWLSQRVTANIVPTSWLGSLLQLNRAKTILHGLPRRAVAPEGGGGLSVPIFVFLGRLVSTKGVRVLIEAAGLLKAKNREFEVRIIGDGPERRELEKRVSDLGAQSCVQFLGYVPSERLEENLSAATAVVMPSLGGEVFGLVAAENMQMGKLVIASDIGALSEVLGDAGMTFATGDAEHLARCMDAVIADPALAEQLGRKALRRIAEVFAADQMVDNHMRVYQESSSH